MRKRNRSSRHRSARGGFTLLEVLIATAVTLLMMVSLAQVFKIIGDSMKQGRASLQLNNTLRSISFRLRHDLNNLTLRIDPPADAHDGSGYFEYFDGAMTDYTCAMFDPNNGTNSAKAPTDVVRSSRFGDLDDILMFTATSSDSWFMGQVPQFVLVGNTPTNAEDYNMVTISSRHAEIAVFARPLDVDGDGTYDDADGDGMADGYQLYYRTLLIRPDLNDPVGASTTDGMLPGVYNASGSKWMVAFPQPGLPAYVCDMALAHQQCDLSLRRVCTGDFVANGYDRIAANSLEDLMDPANRFAHVRMPIPQSSSTTMPVLALDAGLPILNSSGSVYGNNWTTFGVGAGFLHEAFVLGRLPSTTTRLGEDVLCSDVLAFDAKGYDSSVPILGAKGSDTSATVLTTGNFGAADSEHVVLTPNDPGYVAALSLLTNKTTSDDPVVIGYGGYVDLMWGRKIVCAMPYFGLALSDLPDKVPAGVSTLPTGNYLQSEQSGFRALPSGWRTSSSPNFNVFPPLTSLYRSGKMIGPGSSNNAATPYLFQPTFDTWTTRYESDNIIQTDLSPMTGVVQINGYKTLYKSNAPDEDTMRYSGPADQAADGLDNDGIAGVDDPAETDTAAPFPVRLRGIKVSIRIEDRPTRQVRQMSVANEFVTQ